MPVKLDVANLKAIISSVDRDTEDLVLQMAQLGEAYIKSSFSTNPPSPPYNPPAVDTGFLKANIVSRRVSRNTAIIFSGAEYSAPLEYGTSVIEPRPFMLPAVYYVLDKLLGGQIDKVNDLVLL